MKKTLLSLFLCFCISIAFSQDYILPMDENGQVVFTDIKNTGLDKNAMFKNAQSWTAGTFGDYKAVIQFEDKESGKLVLGAQSKISAGPYQRIRYKVSITVKDNKYRCVIEGIEANYYLDGVPNLWFPVTRRNELIKQSKINIDSMGVVLSSISRKRDVNKLTDAIEKEKESMAKDMILNEEINKTIGALMASLDNGLIKKDDF